jgi:hypothetical protein
MRVKPLRRIYLPPHDAKALEVFTLVAVNIRERYLGCQGYIIIICFSGTGFDSDRADMVTQMTSKKFVRELSISVIRRARQVFRGNLGRPLRK